jgi:hypothetical protein
MFNKWIYFFPGIVNLSGKNPSHEHGANACDNEISLEMVMKELQTMKTLLNMAIENQHVVAF